eukprot:c17444_g1_i2 orf=94-333(+)
MFDWSTCILSAQNRSLGGLSVDRTLYPSAMEGIRGGREQGTEGEDSCRDISSETQGEKINKNQITHDNIPSTIASELWE